MATYILKIANSDCAFAEEFNKEISSGTESADSISINVARDGTDAGRGYTPTGVPNNNDWETGDITVEVNVTTADMNMDLSVQVGRINSTCLIQQSTAFTAPQTLGSTGVFTFTFSSINWSAGSTGDRLRVVYRFTTAAHGGADVVIETGTTDTEIITAISEGSPPVSRRIFITD